MKKKNFKLLEKFLMKIGNLKFIRQLTNKTLLKTNRDIQFMNTIIEKNRLSLTNINTTNS